MSFSFLAWERIPSRQTILMAAGPVQSKFACRNALHFDLLFLTETRSTVKFNLRVEKVKMKRN